MGLTDIEYHTKCSLCFRDIVITATTLVEIQALQEKINKPQVCDSCSQPSNWDCE